jgi:peptide/nickel transport system permease protein
VANYVLRRITRTVLVLGALTVFVFALLHLSGDPAVLLAGDAASPADIERMRQFLGLSDPLPLQYLRFLQHAAVGDFGTSFRYREPAIDLVLARMPATTELSVAAVAIGLLIGVPLGVLAAERRGSTVDTASVGLSVVARAVPSFWLGLMLILLFAVGLQWLPTSGRGSPDHLILPAVTLSASFLAEILLLTRAGMMSVLDEDYVRTARAKGLTTFTIDRRHALPNAALPLVSAIGVIFTRVIGGAVVIETVFSWPGVGSLAVDGLTQRDYPIVLASVTVLALLVSVINLVTDLSYGFLDPRIRRG